MPDPLVYFNGAFRPRSEVHLSPDDRGFLFADGVYEVVRFYDGHPFELDAHLRRLERSLRAVRIGGVEVEAFRDVFARLIRENGLRDATCYLQITRGVAPRQHAFPAAETPPTVFASAKPLAVDPARWERGVRVLLVPDQRWARCDIKSTALLPNVLANQRAQEAGAEEAVFVRDGVVTEGSHTNVAAVFDGCVYTHPASTYILPGITRQVVLRLCRELGVPCREQPVLAEDLPRASEVMLWSTSAEVLPVVEVDDSTVGTGQPGPIAQKLLQVFRAYAASTR